ncbi:efflux RND transporter permease subunit [Thermonema rossianum]|uniref:efflux RND transporter permease subunit n=1 Tax=Thermonema rossianum TaxID=55505 RepID=UPI0005705000|nr:efflux RND transporter permease subunit [Thermonema rossianum]
MFSYLFQRPIAVLMVSTVVVIFSIVAFLQLPVSLLPDIDVPQMVVKVRYPGASPREVEQQVLRLLRENMLTLQHLREIESQAEEESGRLLLFFDYGTNMDLAFIEANEVIDHLGSHLPRHLERPQVVRLNTTDVPIARLQVTYRHTQTGGSAAQLSDMAEKVLKKRIEALPGVAMVDLNGLYRRSLWVFPQREKLMAHRIDEQQLIQTIKQNNSELTSISIRDGNYRYYLRIGAPLQDVESLRRLPIQTAGQQVLQLGELAHIVDSVETPKGFHLFNLKEGVVINIHKQSSARMPEVMQTLDTLLVELRHDYPNLDFTLTQSQYEVLDMSISNLKNDLLFGGIGAFLVLLLFIGNYRVPFLIGVVLPTSLIMSFSVFYLFDVSLNVISLAGLTLGLGMTIDNAIIIFDHIGKMRKAGMPLLESCVKGTSEMVAPLVSSALTTQAVFIPLVFLDGLSGALSYDQAVAVGAILFTSLLVSFFLLPLLYLLLFRNSNQLPREDNRLYLWALRGYKKLYHWCLARRRLVFPTLLVAGVAGLGIAFLLPIEGMPTLKRKDMSVHIEWNEPLSANENRRRVEALLRQFSKHYHLSESDIGQMQYLMQTANATAQQATIYFLFNTYQERKQFEQLLSQYFSRYYPGASVHLGEAPNIFDMLFRSDKPYWSARFRSLRGSEPVPIGQLQRIADSLRAQLPQGGWQADAGMEAHTLVSVEVRQQALQRYGVHYQQLLQTLKATFAENTADYLHDFNEAVPIVVAYRGNDFHEKLHKSYVVVDSLRRYPLSLFVDIHTGQTHRSLTADRAGIYHALHATNAALPIDAAEALSSRLAQAYRLRVDFSGQHYDNRQNIGRMLFILALSVLLLYFILSIEFESLRQPLIVIFTLPLGFTGSFLLLWLAGESLNIMAAIGLVVMLGIIDNESILKIDAINRLRQSMPLDEAIAKAGEITFKPIFMTSLTNILALTPFLFDSSMAGDLQRPFVLAIIGGLSIGSFISLFFVPLMYRALTARKSKAASFPGTKKHGQ